MYNIYDTKHSKERLTYMEFEDSIYGKGKIHAAPFANTNGIKL